MTTSHPILPLDTLATPPAEHPCRELDHRQNDGLMISLYWLPKTDEIVVSVLDWRDPAESFAVSVPHDRAVDAFEHPFRYRS